MALTMNFIAPKGVNIAEISGIDNAEIVILNTEKKVDNGYVIIAKVNGGKSSIVISADFCLAKNSTVFVSKEYIFTPSVMDGAVNFVKQGYEYLKTLPEFKDAVDC